eukprot:scaffold88320_cov43-Prasinocladus_malaysianus.AAC.1
MTWCQCGAVQVCKAGEAFAPVKVSYVVSKRWISASWSYGLLNTFASMKGTVRAWGHQPSGQVAIGVGIASACLRT